MAPSAGAPSGSNRTPAARAPQQLLRRDPRLPRARVQRLEIARHLHQRRVYQLTDRPQRVALRNPRLQIHIAEQITAALVLAPHDLIAPIRHPVSESLQTPWHQRFFRSVLVMSKIRLPTLSHIEVVKGSEVSAEASRPLKVALRPNPCVSLSRLGPDRFPASHMPMTTAEPPWFSHPTHLGALYRVFRVLAGQSKLRCPTTPGAGSPSRSHSLTTSNPSHRLGHDSSPIHYQSANAYQGQC